MTDPFEDAVALGALPNADAVLHVRESVSGGMRAIDVAPFGGISVRILPDRGLDLGQAWFRGIPLAWVSEIGESPPLSDLTGMAWGEAFGGGLMVTCGLRNVGMPSEGHGLHGSFSHLPASDVAVDTSLDAGIVTVAGTIVDEEEPRLVVTRTITIAARTGRIAVEDVTSNEGTSPADAPLLYHCNFGYPLWSGGARLGLAPVTTYPRDEASRDVLDAWDRPMEIGVGPERVLEHHLDSPTAWARVSNRDLGVALTIRWDGFALPWVNQWFDPNPGMAVLGVEPANCRTRGRAFERDDGSLPALEPGEVRRTTLTFEAGVDGMTGSIDGVIWDVDGTLADTIPMIVIALQDTIEAYTGSVHTSAEIQAMFGPTEEGLLRNAIGDQWPEAMERYLVAYDEAHRDIGSFDGVSDVIEQLAERGIAMAVVTGKGARSAAITIDRLGLGHRFDEVSAGSMEGQVKEVGIRRIVERWGFPPHRVAYIGDHAADVRDAKAAGVVAVTAAWKPDTDLDPILPLAPDVILHSTDELAIWADQVTR